MHVKNEMLNSIRRILILKLFARSTVHSHSPGYYPNGFIRQGKCNLHNGANYVSSYNDTNIIIMAKEQTGCVACSLIKLRQCLANIPKEI